MVHGAFNKFPDFFVQAFKIVVDSWKFTMLLLYILWNDWPIFMISRSNKQLQQEFEYTLLNPDCHSWWISKMQSGHEDTLEEQYAIKFYFKLGKNATEVYGMLQTAFGASAWVEHQFLIGIRDSRKAGSLWGRMRGVGGVIKSIQLIGQRVRVRVTNPKSSGRDSIRRGQHSSNWVSGISTRTMHQSTTPSLSQTIWPRWASRHFLTLPIVQTFLPVTFHYSLSAEAVIMR